MKLIDYENTYDPAVNLALEEYCVRNLNTENESYLLFYINEPSIIIGKHQNTIEEINSEYVAKHNIHVVRRISGGGAVYHDRGNLNFSFITKYSQEHFHNFELFTRPVIKTLNNMGINAVLGGRNDITVEGRKVSGNAQFTNLKSMFSHGTLLFDSHLENVAEALNVRQDKIESKGIKSVRSRVANISEFLEHKITVEDLKQRLINSIFEEYEKLPVVKMTTDQRNEVINLSESKYKTWQWNYGRSPEFNVQRVRRFECGQIDARIFVKEGIIKDIKLYGDFLGYGDSDNVEKALKGKPYKYDVIFNLAEKIDLKFYFGNITAEEFAKHICP